MCGIAGLIRPAVQRADVQAMASCLNHRGPDASGSTVLAGGRVGLAHQRLSIIDPTDHGLQPMTSPKGACVVFNGEIYNYLELRAELEGFGHKFVSDTDTEVLLAAYDQWDTGALSRLNGMFAFAIVDMRRDRVLLARDRFGEKPLYYVPLDGGFAFASEIKAFRHIVGFRLLPNHTAIHGFLTRRELDRDPDTFFDGVYAVRAGHFMSVGLDGRATVERSYWRLVPPDEPADRQSSDLIEEYRSLLVDSIRLRLRADVPVGSSLSGGLDSSAIVGFVAQQLEGLRPHTFSARFPGTAVDEGRYIRGVVERWNAVGHEVAPDPAQLPSEIERLVYHQEQPFTTLSVYAQWCVMRLARDHGVTVLLDGQGADEALAGYQWYLASHVRDLVSRGRIVDAGRRVASHLSVHGIRSLPPLLYHLLPPRLAIVAKSGVRARAIPHDYSWHVEPASLEEPSRLRTRLDRALHASLTRTMLPSLLRYADRNSMAFSREVRLPFLDHRLVELSFTLPSDLKIGSGVSKIILRRAAENVLPPIVKERRDKVGYAPPYGHWMKGPLREWLDDLFATTQLDSRPWLDAAVVRSVWRSYMSGSNRYEPDIMRWLSMEMWARTYLDFGGTQ